MSIEDYQVVAMELQQSVRDLGRRVPGIAAAHGDGVSAFQETDAGLVLADIQLADGSSGIDAVQDILAIAPVPAIFITAFPERLLTGGRVEPTRSEEHTSELPSPMPLSYRVSCLEKNTRLLRLC